MQPFIFNNREYVTPKEISQTWGVSARTIREYCKKGLVPGFFVDNRKYYIPSTAKKPDPRNIKAALALCKEQSNCGISTEAVEAIIRSEDFCREKDLLFSTNFIRTHSQLGEGRFELTAEGEQYLSEWKDTTKASFLNKFFKSAKLSVEYPDGFKITASIEFKDHLR